MKYVIEKESNTLNWVIVHIYLINQFQEFMLHKKLSSVTNKNDQNSPFREQEKRCSIFTAILSIVQ